MGFFVCLPEGFHHSETTTRIGFSPLLGMVNTMVNTLRSMVLEYLQSQHLPERPKSPSFVGKYTTHGASGLGYFYMSFSTNKKHSRLNISQDFHCLLTGISAFLTKIAVYENGAENKKNFNGKKREWTILGKL